MSDDKPDAVDVPVVFPVIRVTLSTVVIGKRGQTLAEGEDSINFELDRRSGAERIFRNFFQRYLEYVAKQQANMDGEKVVPITGLVKP